jgi:hypothetical protein
MSPWLLAPIFAQTITLGVTDRTEGLYLIQQQDKRWEGATSPSAALSFAWRRSSLGLSYGPSFRISPLDRAPRELTVFHLAGVQTGYRFRQTSLTLTSTLGFGELNLRMAALQAPDSVPSTQPNGAGNAGQQGQPAPAGAAGQPSPGAQGGAPGTPTNPALQQQYIVDRVLRVAAWTTTAGVTHNLARTITLGATMGYADTGGWGTAAQLSYPRSHAWVIGASGSYRYLASRADSFATLLTTQHTWASTRTYTRQPDQTSLANVQRNTVTVAAVNESWLHAYNKRTSSDLGAGLSVSRLAQFDGLVAISIFPTFSAGLNHTADLARGGFTVSVRAFSAPVVDTRLATLDPRVGASTALSWTRDRFATNLTGAAAFSLADSENRSRVDSASGGLSMSYRAHDFVSIDTGVRANVQKFNDLTAIPPSYAAFVGVTLGYQLVLSGK